MSSRASQPSLPPEIILSIVDCVVPSEVNSRIAFEPSHTITKTLLALTRTARIIYPTARRLLYTHCLYLDTPRSLRCVLNSLAAYLADTTIAKSPLTPTQSSSPLPTSLYLAPYLAPHFDDSIADLNTTSDVYDLLRLLKPTLRRIVTAIPLRSLHPIGVDSDGILRTLHDSFLELTSVEFFCSSCDDLFLNYDEEWRAERWVGSGKISSLWPKLKLLAVYKAWLGSDVFWRDVTSLENLDTLVLIKADGVRVIDFGREWQRVCGDKNRKLTVWFVDVDGGQGIPETVKETKEGDNVTLRVARVPTSYYGDENEIDLCQNWIKQAALNGEEAIKAELEYLSA